MFPLYLSRAPYDSSVIVDCASVISTNAPAGYMIQPVGELAFTTLYNDSVVTLIDGFVEAGEHTVTFDGNQSASGVYFYQLEAGDFIDTRKMILLK
jgi:hypothetical protein